MFTKIVEGCSRKGLMPVINDMNTYLKNEFTRRKSHINGIENFWGIAKVRF